MSNITVGQLLAAVLQMLGFDPNSAPSRSSTPAPRSSTPTPRSSTPNGSDRRGARTPPNTPATIRVAHSSLYSGTSQDSATSWYAVTRGRAVGVVMGWKVAEKMTNVKQWTCRRCDTEKEAWDLFFRAQAKGKVIIFTE
ncbi:hypothetical protein BD779DRAFT_1677878 [Infundibulicybe gibba]|nr:hypothetical protein BD779DRAFT_1677878 [Infundibulicybe gibba]